jgi:hypothetical protein
MKLYADLPARATRQLVADLCVLGWTLLWIGAGKVVHDATLVLAEPGRQLAAAGGGFRSGMNDAGGAVDDLPLLDDRMATPFRSVAGVGSQIEGAGNDLAAGVGHLATILGLTTALVPILLVGAVWFALRLRFVRRASAAQRLLDDGLDLDLFALRALARQPLPRILRTAPDAAHGWRAGDPDTVRRLARLELASSGIRVPAGGPSLAE